MEINLKNLENQLKKRLDYPYHWGKKQTDDWDKKTNFIYQVRSFSDLQGKAAALDDSLRNYAFNRWLNFWSAKAVEKIFALHPKVIANTNEYDKLVDFSVEGIAFDHKTSVFPKGFGKSLEQALSNKGELIRWLYNQQSQQGRKHYENRIFIVLYDRQTEAHWKLKAEIQIIGKAIANYLHNFSVEKLEEFDFGQGKVFSDIIWVIKE